MKLSTSLDPVSILMFFVEDRPSVRKVLISDLPKETRGPDEYSTMKLVRDTNPQSIGWHHVSQLLNSFTHTGPNGEHVYLILEPL
ncbi:hypothetical protein QCA50_018421 [Cerrena zonata]|uniref:Uncharacterized protein n=1 Tax=Cerrena zonata TaxID=2478898 RepID=A0AAW0FK45_9APHY